MSGSGHKYLLVLTQGFDEPVEDFHDYSGFTSA